MSELDIRRVVATSLHDLRRRVLRGGDSAANVTDPRDDEPSALHFAGVLGERVVACASFYPTPSQDHPDAVAYQLRYVATEADERGRGYAARLLAVGEEELRRRGARILWANGRDSALGFYRREGWSLVAGSEHLSRETQLPHTRIFKELI